VASRIAQTRRPQAVLDYLAEPGLARSEQMDAAVREEGVQSLLGVPLVANSTVLGVLFVGTRTRHEYTADEVAVLSALADHAAIALLRSLRFGDLERSGDEAVARAAAWEQYFRDQRRVLDVVDELFDAVLSGEDVHHVIGTLAQAVGRQLVLVDEAGGVIAATGDARPQPDPVETTGDPQTPESVGSSESPALPGAGARFRATPDSPDTEAVVVVETRTSGVLRLHVLRAPHGSALLSPETVVRGAQVCAFAHLLGSASRLREDRLRDRLLSAGRGARPRRRRMSWRPRGCRSRLSRTSSWCAARPPTSAGPLRRSPAAWRLVVALLGLPILRGLPAILRLSGSAGSRSVGRLQVDRDRVGRDRACPASCSASTPAS
jgi:hypothetical protein